MANILVVDDDKRICQLLLEFFSGLGHEVDSASTLEAALRQAQEGVWDVVFLDVQMPDGSGLDLIKPLRQIPQAPEVIILTGHGNAEGARIAIGNGAWDYLEKPPTLDQLRLALGRVLEYRLQKSLASPARVLDRGEIVGESPALRNCLDAVASAAPSEASVLVMGETGTGKELVSRAIHRNSPRRDQAFVVVDCAALPPTLVESTLFGHEKGSFTSAGSRFGGLLRKADGGTLFLDEVGELPMEVQKKLLRALQERRFLPLGSDREVRSNFRVVAATNRDLDEMARQNLFRRDLLFRLGALQITVPPLRERMEDMKPLAMHFCQKLCDAYEVPSKGFSPDFFEALSHYHWPGNVRELANTMENVLTVALDLPILFAAHLPLDLRIKLVARRSGLEESQAGEALGSGAPPQPDLESTTLKDYRNQAADEAENIYLRHLLARHRDQPALAQQISGLSKSRFYSLLQKHGLGQGD